MSGTEQPPCVTDCDIMTQSSVSIPMDLLSFLRVGWRLGSYIYTEGDHTPSYTNTAHRGAPGRCALNLSPSTALLRVCSARHAHMSCCSARAGWDTTRREPRPGLSANPSTPCSKKRCAHLYTKRRLIPTVAPMSVIVTPSAKRKIIRPRLARPAEMVVDRCHARSVW